MEIRNLAISLDTAKEWYRKGGELKILALQAFKEDELVNKRVSSLEEFCEKNEQSSIAIIGSGGMIKHIVFSSDYNYNTNCYPTAEYAEAMRAFQKLLFLYYSWNCKKGNLVIRFDKYDKNIIVVNQAYHGVFNFQCADDAREFITTFKDLLLEAAPLL